MKLFCQNEKKTECHVCKKIFSTSGNLKTHLWQVHNLGDGKWFYCEQDECNYKCKQSGTLKQHLSGFHDFGPLICQYCFRKVFKLNEYKDPKMKTDVKICRDCFNKSTGCSTSKEKQMVDYITSQSDLRPFIVLKDKILRHHSCNTRRRPDLLLSEPCKLHIFVECDENQHQGYNPPCESGRMDEFIDEFKEGRIVFIRWNPDHYVVSPTKPKVKRKERLKRLVELIRNIYKETTSSISDPVHIHYMFYNLDNEVITKRFPHTLHF